MIENATSISVGMDNYAHVCALAGGVVYCWGSNSHGNVGHKPGSPGDMQVAADGLYASPSPQPIKPVVSVPRPFDSVVAGAGHTCAVDRDKKLFCWGYGGYGVATAANSEQARLITGIDVAKVAGRGPHVCALLADNGVRCFGASSFARLGVVELATATDCRNQPVLNTACRLDPQLAVVTNALTVDATDNTVVLTRDGKIATWGPNEYATLGVPRGEATCPNTKSAPPSVCSATVHLITLP